MLPVTPQASVATGTAAATVDGQGDHDPGACGGLAFHLDRTAVLLDDAIDDGHSDAGAGVEEALERVEELGALLLGHAVAGIGELDAVGLAPEPAADPQLPAVGHRAQGVACEIPEDLADLVGIAGERRRVRIQIEDELVPSRGLLGVAQQGRVLG